MNELVSALEQICSLKFVKYDNQYMLTDPGFKHVLHTINSVGISVGKEKFIEDKVRNFFRPLRSLPQLVHVPVDVPTSSEIDEQNSEDYRSLSSLWDAEFQDENLKLVLQILASLQTQKCEQRRQTTIKDDGQKALKYMKYDEEID